MVPIVIPHADAESLWPSRASERRNNRNTPQRGGREAPLTEAGRNDMVPIVISNAVRNPFA